MIVFCAVSVGKTVLEGVILFGCGVDRIDQFELHAAGELAALAGTRDHFVGDLLGRGGNEVVMCQFMLLEQLYNRLRAEIVFCIVHWFLSFIIPPLRGSYKRPLPRVSFHFTRGYEHNALFEG